mgnify:FL=1|tara:strand:+ start:2728 stop:3735 length:1008 start_codon:yes stop_codon:yes gene_type:complete
MNYLVAKVTPNDVTVIIDGKHKRIRKDSPDAELVIALVKQYNSCNILTEREDIVTKIEELCNPAKKIEFNSDGRFEFDGNSAMYLKGTSDPIPEFLAKKLLEYIDKGLNVEALVNFWKNTLLNPDKGVRQQLFGFLEHNGHPITDKGYFLAYKAVKVARKYDAETGEEVVSIRYDENTGERIEETLNQSMTFKPYHSGAHGMTVKVGEPITMPREECDSDPEVTCSAGLHVGSMEYVHDFGYSGGVILEVLVSPRNVVAVPTDYNNTKMRTCEYYPIAITNGENDAIYLESDYASFDHSTMEDDIVNYEESKRDVINEIEKELAERRAVADSLLQ